jgi:putative phosphoribosyl transferase
MRDDIFRDRAEAGRELARAVGGLIGRHPEIADPVVLALPRGGVPVALEIARALGAPLDLVMVRKIGVPFQPELAAAAVVNGSDPQVVRNEEIIRQTGMTEADIAAARDRELGEIARRREAWLAGRAPVPVKGRDAILVDDGIATGATVRAALRGVAAMGPRSLALAVPVAPPDTVAALEGEVDHLVCLSQPEPFFAIGAHYADFSQLSDGDVERLLSEAGQSGAG